jgi:hypothetical protein
MAGLAGILSIMLTYRRSLGRWPNLVRPRRYTERMQLAKLTWRDPLMTVLADKVLAKEYVARVLGPEWVTPTLFAGAALPPRAERDWPVPYVIKANHRSKANIFVRKPEDAEWNRIEPIVENWLSHSYGQRNGEWAYRDMKRQVLVEPFIGGDQPMASDYQFWTFGGKVGFAFLAWDRVAPPGKPKVAMVDRDYLLLPFNASGRPSTVDLPPRPDCFEAMIGAAETLAAGFPSVRVDFYVVDGQPRFGEVTFYGGTGLLKFYPPEYDLIVGEMWPPGLPAGQGH